MPHSRQAAVEAGTEELRRAIFEQELGIEFVGRPRRAALAILNARRNQRREFMGIL
jgi:hypothetical protein